MKTDVTALFELRLSKPAPLTPDEHQSSILKGKIDAAYAKLQALADEYDADNPINNTSNDRVFVLKLPEQSRMLGELIHNAVICRYPYNVRFFALEVG